MTRIQLQLRGDQYYLVRATGIAGLEIIAVSVGADLAGQEVGFRTWIQREADPPVTVEDGGL